MHVRENDQWVLYSRQRATIARGQHLALRQLRGLASRAGAEIAASAGFEGTTTKGPAAGRAGRYEYII